MAFLMTHPEALATAAGHLDGIGFGGAAENAVTAAATTRPAPAAADEVSAVTATHFSAHAALHQTVGAQAMAVHELSTAISLASAGSYAATETASTIAVDQGRG